MHILRNRCVYFRSEVINYHPPSALVVALAGSADQSSPVCASADQSRAGVSCSSGRIQDMSYSPWSFGWAAKTASAAFPASHSAATAEAPAVAAASPSWPAASAAAAAFSAASRSISSGSR